jgi:hypothetical protein
LFPAEYEAGDCNFFGPSSSVFADAANTLTEQQALNAIDVSRSFTDQAVALAVRAPEILQKTAE